MKRYQKQLGAIAIVAIVCVGIAILGRPKRAIARTQWLDCKIGKGFGRLVNAGVYQGRSNVDMYMVFEDHTGRITVFQDCGASASWDVRRIEGRIYSEAQLDE